MFIDFSRFFELDMKTIQSQISLRKIDLDRTFVKKLRKP